MLKILLAIIICTLMWVGTVWGVNEVLGPVFAWLYAFISGAGIFFVLVSDQLNRS